LGLSGSFPAIAGNFLTDDPFRPFLIFLPRFVQQFEIRKFCGGSASDDEEDNHNRGHDNERSEGDAEQHIRHFLSSF
jgi:hypothetical protein